MKQGIKIILMLCVMISSVNNVHAEEDNLESHDLVSMRMIGHQFLLNIGNDSSIILPIIKQHEKFKIRFATEFEFYPEKLQNTIRKIVSENNIAKHYILEVVECETDEIVNSFEVGNIKSEMLPCKDRKQPRSCYYFLFTKLDPEASDNFQANQATIHPKLKLKQGESLSGLKIIAFTIFIVAALIVAWRIRLNKKSKTELISIGAYYFDELNMQLLYKGNRVDLTGKETKLLLLLYNSINKTIERDIILKNVWGDEGDYIGRTLDVFISKLRKKLEADSTIKIINIRGVGYKLILS